MESEISPTEKYRTRTFLLGKSDTSDSSYSNSTTIAMWTVPNRGTWSISVVPLKRMREASRPTNNHTLTLRMRGCIFGRGEYFVLEEWSTSGRGRPSFSGLRT